jgi:hypothetical protein
MSQTINLPTSLTPANTVTLTAEIVTAHVIADTLVISLTESQDTGLLPVSTETEAALKDIFEMGGEYPALFPDGVTAATIAAMLQEEKDCDKLEASYSALAAIMGHRSKVLRNNRRVYGIETLDNGKLAAKKDTGVKVFVTNITTTHYKHGAKKTASSYSINGGTVIALAGVVTGKTCVNTGNTILSFLVKNGNAINTITVNPKSSFKIPLDWTNIVVTNLSATEAGSFDIFMK